MQHEQTNSWRLPAQFRSTRTLTDTHSHTHTHTLMYTYGVCELVTNSALPPTTQTRPPPTNTTHTETS